MPLKLCSIFVFTMFMFFTAQSQAPTIAILPPVITNLNFPLQIVNANDGTNRLYVVEKAGRIKVFQQTGLDAFTLLDTLLHETSILTNGEQGLLSMAFHPQYESNGYIFIYYVNSGGNLELARYTRSTSNSNEASPGSKVILLTINHPTNTNHNGGKIFFGSDGYLYLSTGDGGGANDTPNNAQNILVNLGKMLRINVNSPTTPPYHSAAPGNPYNSLIFATGLRNPFRWSFDRHNNDAWIGDVGQDAYEEVNHVTSMLGLNFGWRCYEGDTIKNLSGCGPIGNYTFPAYDYPTQNPAATVIGGMVYRGYIYDALKGYYLSVDYYSGKFYILKYIEISDTYEVTIQTISNPLSITDFGENEAGELYCSASSTNSVYRVKSNGLVRNTYTFTGSGLWTDAYNWLNNLPPPTTLAANDHIVISPKSDGYCSLNVVQLIPSQSYISIEPGSLFHINSNLTIQN